LPDPRRVDKSKEGKSGKKKEGGGWERLQDEEEDEDEDVLLVDAPALTHSPRRVSIAAGSGSAGLLRSEVEQLDESLRTLKKDPKAEVLENLKRRHGVGRSASVQAPPASTSLGGSLTDVASFPGEDLDRATLMMQTTGKTRSQSIASTSGTTSGKTAKLLRQEQDDLERTMQRLDPRFVGRQTTIAQSTSSSALTPEPEKLAPPPDWSPTASVTSMPEIKASLPVKGMKKGSLQPLPPQILPGKQKKGKKKFSIARSLGLSNGSAADFTDMASINEARLPRASRLPAIGGNSGLHLGDGPRQKRRNPMEERTKPLVDLNASLSSNKSDSSKSSRASSGGAMVNFEGIERPWSAVPEDNYSDIPKNVLDDVPDALGDLTTEDTFHEIPQNVFEAIPSAMNEKEEKRFRRNEEEMLRERALELENRKAAEVYLDGRNGKQAILEPRPEGEEESQPQMMASSVSLITALFPRAVEVADVGAGAPVTRGEGPSPGPVLAARPDEQQQVESDLVFALFIQEREQMASSQRPPTSGRRSSRRPRSHSLSGLPRAPPTPDPNDPDVGHFCAPHVPGFCQANFCIFHHPVVSHKVMEQ